jgi:hypothetical protein
MLQFYTEHLQYLQDWRFYVLIYIRGIAKELKTYR